MTYAAYKCDLWRVQPSVWETAIIVLILQNQVDRIVQKNRSEERFAGESLAQL